MDEKLIFQVEWEAVINGEKMSGVESEASWFLIDQQGRMYSYGPMEPIKLIEKAYTKCVPLLKVNDKWMSIDKIEALEAENARLRQRNEQMEFENAILCSSIDRMKQQNAELVEALKDTQGALHWLLSLKHTKDTEGKTNYYRKYKPIAWQEAEKAESKARAILANHNKGEIK